MTPEEIKRQALLNMLDSLGLSDEGGTVIDPLEPEEKARSMKNGMALLDTLRKMRGDS